MVYYSLGDSVGRKQKPEVSNSEALDVIIISWMVLSTVIGTAVRKKDIIV